jgi:UDP-N-acetylglucosamine 1-carboxyvinyltransferase
LAGLAAEGETEVCGLEHLDRGYEDIVLKLRSLGAQVTRGSELPAPGGLRVCSI